MTSMTFESFAHSPRRAAARRTVRAQPVAVPRSEPTAIARSANAVATGSKTSKQTVTWAVAIGLTFALHAVVFTIANRPAQIAPLPRKAPELALEIAPPPPPPPPPKVEPKPLPKVVAVKPVAAPKPPPSLPVVQNVSNDAPSADSVQVATTPPPAPVAQPAPPPEPITEPRGFAGYLNNPAPVYPSAAQKRGLQGRVVLKVHVLASGQADNVTIAKTSGFDILDDAAVKAVSGWQFDPAKRGQTPIDGWVNVPINFKIS